MDAQPNLSRIYEHGYKETNPATLAITSYNLLSELAAWVVVIWAIGRARYAFS